MKNTFNLLVGRSPAMQELFRLIAILAPHGHSILIQGESGTGKGTLARALHLASPRVNHPFLTVDCSTLVPSLIESELFGHVKGAFTGADRTTEGLLTSADHGTVFLDEIAELPLHLQSKLLRVLEQKEVRSVGSTRFEQVDIRILAASNRDLKQAAEQGTFRQDLFYRLNVFTLWIPPLRERREDILLLAEHFLKRSNQSTDRIQRLSPPASQRLVEYNWPGNVRELENCIEMSTSLNLGTEIELDDLPAAIRDFHPIDSSNPTNVTNKVAPMIEVERATIENALAYTNGDKRLAARLLGIGKTTLYRKLKEYSRK